MFFRVIHRNSLISGSLRRACLPATIAALASPFLGSMAASAAEVSPEVLTASFVSASSEGALCPGDTLKTAPSEDRGAVSINWTGPGVLESGQCKLVVVFDAPAEFAMGMPLGNVAASVGNDGGAEFQRSYHFAGTGITARFSDSVAVDQSVRFIDRSTNLAAPTCGGTQRVSLEIVVTATPDEPGKAFLDSVELDTSYRGGGNWHSCDPDEPLEITPGQVGDFCDGPSGRPCAAGLVCENSPIARDGTCVEP